MGGDVNGGAEDAAVTAVATGASSGGGSVVTGSDLTTTGARAGAGGPLQPTSTKVTKIEARAKCERCKGRQATKLTSEGQQPTLDRVCGAKTKSRVY